MAGPEPPPTFAEVFAMGAQREGVGLASAGMATKTAPSPALARPVPSKPASKWVYVPKGAPPTEQEDAHPRNPRARREDDPLDPSARHAAQMAPLTMTVGPTFESGDVAGVTSARGSLEALIPMLVKRVAWTPGDGKRRAMRLEISEGHLAGGTLLVQAEGGRVHVRLDAPPHVDAHAWRARIEERLARRGIAVDAIEI